MRTSQDLQATHQIISLVEKSKTNAEQILDRLPDVFMIIDNHGVIKKNNYQGAHLFKCDVEDVLGKNITSVFREETSRIFLNWLEKMTQFESDDERVEFELICDADQENERTYFWSIQPLKGVNRSLYNYYVVNGRDVTMLRAYERQLAEIFASIPLGILTVDGKGLVEDIHSEYARWIFGHESLGGLNLKKLVFEPNWDELKPEQKEAVGNLMRFSEIPAFFFENFANSFPTQIRYTLPAGNKDSFRFLGLKYQPIIYGDQVKKMLIIVEDRTAIVKAEEEQKNRKVFEDKQVQRVIQIKSADQEILPHVIEEIVELLKQVNDCYEAKNARDMKNHLHGVKGNARIAGFQELKDLSHGLESDMAHGDQEKIDWPNVRIQIDKIEDEWDELVALAEALSSKGKGKNKAGSNTSAVNQTISHEDNEELTQTLMELLRRYNAEISRGISLESLLISERILLAIQTKQLKKLTELENVIKVRVGETAKATGKLVDLHFDWSGIMLDKKSFESVSQSLMHLLNNAVDHGIEGADERKAKGKPETGTIEIKAREKGGQIHFTVSDDGRGIKVDRVKSIAVDRGVISLADSVKMTDKDACQLIFAPGFSTAEKVTDISGRGVGLDAVASAIKKHGGKIIAGNSEIAGSIFKFNIVMANKWGVQPVCEHMDNFFNSLRENFDSICDREGVKIHFDYAGLDNDLRQGVAYIDTMRMLVAITTYASELAHEGEVGVYPVRMGEKIGIHMKLEKKLKAKPNGEDLPLPISACREIVEMHSGEVNVEEGEIRIVFGFVLPLAGHTFVVGKSDIVKDVAQLDTFAERLNNLGESLNLNFMCTWKDDDAKDMYPHFVVKSEGEKAKDEEIVLRLGSSSAKTLEQLLKGIEILAAHNSGMLSR